MTDRLTAPASLSADSCLAATLLALDPIGLGGAQIIAGPGPERDAWLRFLRARLDSESPWRRMPISIPDDRLLGGLDLAATLSAGRPVIQRGLLAETDGGVLIIPMAERLERGRAARIAATVDQGSVALLRDGTMAQHDTRFAMILLDERMEDEDPPPPALTDRIAFYVRLDTKENAAPLFEGVDRVGVIQAQALLPSVTAPPALEEAVCGAALAFGVMSPRLSLMALRAARAAAALDGRKTVSEEDASLAVRLVLAPRATQMPMPDEQMEADSPPEEKTPPPVDQMPPDILENPELNLDSLDPSALQDLLIETAKAALPSNLLAGLAARAVSGASAHGGKAGKERVGARRGRPIGSRRGLPSPGQRLHVLDTLRAAAPWQTLRKRERAAEGRVGRARVDVRKEDFRVFRMKERGETLTLFVVDASGSAALNRLSEAKGAVERLLAECYVRRDSVAMIAFSGKGVETLLPPTRSLTRAKRELTALPGGGGTPLADGIIAAMAEADAAQRRGQSPVVVFMTDGSANIARDGAPGRGQAGMDALAAARHFRASGLMAVLVDIAPRPKPVAWEIATALGARYVPLPHADAAQLSGALANAS